MTTVTVAQPHERAEIPPAVWQTPSLTPRAVAGLLADILLAAPNPMYRPVVVARIDPAADTAVLYVTDRHASARILGLLLDLHATPLRTLPAGLSAGDPGVLPGLQTINWWATKPRRGAA